MKASLMDYQTAFVLEPPRARPEWLDGPLAKLPALSIKQPWAHSIVLGSKRVENRTWRTHFRGRFLIHAGKSLDDEQMIAWHRTCKEGGIRDTWAQRVPTHEIPLGGIVGVATLIDCVSESDSPWFCGPWGFVLDQVEPLSFQPCRGQLGFFAPRFE